MTPTILDVEDDGMTITLLDGRKFAINPGDVGKTACWYATQRIQVIAQKKGGYTHVLKNLDTYAKDEAAATRG